MRRGLRAALVALVAVNLGFVHITEASRLAWLGPLFALTLLSPLLLRLTRYWAYRLLWNLAVLGAFALLVHHVTYAGVAHLLEDGLLLAALCQVHLINNISAAQKPDLIFFNSFLVAVVTSYLSLDLGYMLVFLVYAPLFIVTLQLLAFVRADVPEAPGLVRRVVGGGALRGGVVLGLTLLAFLFVPRDFARKGLLGESLRLAPPGSMTEIAFSEQVDLDQSRQVQVSDRVVMTVLAEPGPRLGIPAHWRGATLDYFDGKGWRPARDIYERDGWRLRQPGVWERRQRGTGRRLEVHLADPSASRAFTTLETRQFVVGQSSQQVVPLPDRNFRRVQGDRRPLQYTVVTGEPPVLGGPPRPLSREIRTHISVHPARVPRQARELARALRRDLPDDAEQWRIVAHLSRYLTSRFRYLAPGNDGGARDLAEFLEGKAGAHCEYFATSLAVMLRSESIPCRVVTGYRSEEWDEGKGILTVRARHAHAWVEVLDPRGSWYTVDPTPAVGSAQGRAQGFLGRVRDSLSDVWAAITGFNARGHDRVVEWIRTLPARVLEHPVAAGLVLGGLALALVALRLRRARRANPAIRAYRRTLQRLGLALAPDETPRALLDRARRTAFPAERLRRLEVATLAHEHERYAG